MPVSSTVSFSLMCSNVITSMSLVGLLTLTKQLHVSDGKDQTLHSLAHECRMAPKPVFVCCDKFDSEDPIVEL